MTWRKCWPALAGLMLATLACNALRPPAAPPSEGAPLPTMPPAAPSPTQSLPTPPPEVEAVLADFAGAGEQIGDQFAELDRLIIEQPEAVEAAALLQLEAEDPAVRLAAVYALASTAQSPAALSALRQLLNSPDETERLLAAEALLVEGAKAALPVLIDSLASAAPLSYAEPPQPAWFFAQQRLLGYTEQDFGLGQANSAEAAAATQPAWEAWWAENSEALQWDAETWTFRD